MQTAIFAENKQQINAFPLNFNKHIGENKKENPYSNEVVISLSLNTRLKILLSKQSKIKRKPYAFLFTKEGFYISTVLRILSPTGITLW